MAKRKRVCDSDCNNCPFTTHENSKMITVILNRLLDQYGDGVYQIVQDACPNLTCCFDCRIDDFCHVEGCELIDTPIERKALGRKLKIQEIKSKE